MRYNIVSDGDLRDAAAKMEQAIPAFNHDFEQDSGLKQVGLEPEKLQ